MKDYRLVTYETQRGLRAGFAVGERVFDVAAVTGISSYATILDILNDWKTAQVVFEKTVLGAQEREIEGISLKKAKLLAPILNPSVVFCAGANYEDHMREMASVNNEPVPDPRGPGSHPWHFIKASRSVVGTEASITLPTHSQMVDWEAELVAVVGRPARNVALDKALDYLAGYTIGNDLSARDRLIRSHIPENSPFKYDWVSHKSFDGSCPLGPWIVPARDVADPQNLGIRLWVNDVLKQDSHTSKMIFSVAEQVAHLSSRITLHPGDLILTGTPAGVGFARHEFLKSGDIVRVWIERIGTITNTLV